MTIIDFKFWSNGYKSFEVNLTYTLDFKLVFVRICLNYIF